MSFLRQIGKNHVSWYVALVQLLDKQGKRYNTFWSTLKKTLTWHEVSVHASIHPPEISISCLGSKCILRAIKTSAGVWLAFIHSYCPPLSPAFHSLMYKAQYLCLTHLYFNFCSIVFSFACSCTHNKRVLMPNVSDKLCDSVSCFRPDERSFSYCSFS